MTREEAKAIITLCIDEGVKQGVVKAHEFEELLDFLDNCDKQPSLPSNLNDAEIDKEAKEYAFNNSDDNQEYMNGYLGFKAGAEWMAGQGVILNLSIDELSCGAYNACVEQGLTSEDDVIIQIRKKEE